MPRLLPGKSIQEAAPRGEPGQSPKVFLGLGSDVSCLGRPQAPASAGQSARGGGAAQRESAGHQGRGSLKSPAGHRSARVWEETTPRQGRTA